MKKIIIILLILLAFVLGMLWWGVAHSSPAQTSSISLPVSVTIVSP